MIEHSDEVRASSPRSLEHGLSILEWLAVAGGDAGVTELSQALGLTKSTVHRLISSLTKRGYLIQDQVSKKYRLSLRIYELGITVLRQAGLHRVALTLLERLSELTGETVHLAVLSEGSVVFVQSVESTQTIRAQSRLGCRLPAYCTAPGKVMLSFSADALAAAHPEGGLRRITANTIVAPQAFYLELENIRRLGYAIDREEYQEGLSCVASPVRDYTGRAIASVAVAAPSARMHERRIAEVVPMVSEIASQISHDLGYRPDGRDSEPLNWTSLYLLRDLKAEAPSTD